MSSSVDDAIAVFRATFKKDKPFCTGTFSLDENSSSLFYRAGDNAGVANFLNLKDDRIEALTQACDPATFGLNQQDVLDESYRKAWKMDAKQFSTQFSPINSGIMDTIQQALVKRGEDWSRSIRVELYKLNVYGPGSFFKAHVDTPRAANMFGSLVVILPTKHEGGSLTFRHQGEEWTFDSAEAVSGPGQGAFVAFYSDVEHEVAVVNSGYRVTLTYNLYSVEAKPPSITMPDQYTKMVVGEALVALLVNPDFLPNGGLIGFGLSYKYPFNREDPDLRDILKMLKGVDLSILLVALALKLDVKLKAIITTDRGAVAGLLDHFNIGESQIDEDSQGLPQTLKEWYGATLVRDVGSGKPDQYDAEAEEITWINPLNEANHVKRPYVAYGNEATLSYAYGNVCFVARLEAYEARVKVSPDDSEQQPVAV